MTLLIVNDEILTVKILKDDINWCNYGIDDVYTACSAKDAKKLIEDKSIDIILCDIEMPGENGISLLRWIREHNFSIECIFLTCHANFEYAKEAIMLDCRNYILIPARNEEIGEAVQKVIMQIQTKREEKIILEYGKSTLKKKIQEESSDLQEKKKLEELMQQSINYIMENIGEQELSVEKVANSVFMHPVYLNRIFKKYYKISIGKFIVEERMKYAARLLTMTDLSVSTVAEKVGYSYYANFNVMFKKYYGVTPTHYQRELHHEEKSEIGKR